MEGSSKVAALKILNQDFIKLDRFDGTNFTRWQDKMIFLLTQLKISYILDPNLQPIPPESADDTDRIKEERKKREEDELVCRGHILNTLSDRLYDLFTQIKSARQIWTSLEAKYKTEKIGTDKFLTLKYFEFKMVDNRSLMDQINDLQVIVSKLRDLKIEVPESIQVGAIIAKLPPTWNDYRKKLLHMTEEFTLEKLYKHLRIEEENRIRDGMHPSSNINNITHNNGSKIRKFVKVNKKGFKKQIAPSLKRKNTGCFHCGKPGHYMRQCRFLKKQKIENGSTSNTANVVEEDLIAMISAMQIDMVTELNMAAVTKSSDWWFDSGATIHVCNNKDQFKSYEAVEDGQEVLVGNGNTVKVEGKGKIELTFTSGKRLILMNVLHVPEIKKNLVSANLVCKNGIKAVFRI